MSAKNPELNIQTQELPPFALGGLNQVWQTLTAPPDTLTDPTERRRSRLLASMLIVVVLMTGLILTMQAAENIEYVDDADFVGTLIAMVAVGGLYVLTRRGHTNIPAACMIAMMVVLLVIVPFAPTSMGALLWYTSVPVLITAIFFSVHHVLLVAVFAAIAPLFLQQLTGKLPGDDVLHVSQFTALNTAVIVTYINHTRALEKIRRTELEEAYAKVKESEAVLEQRVRERTAELRKAKEEAEEANHVKSQFLASMSHELRTPLNAILTFTELIAMGTFGPVNEEQVDYLQKSLSSGKHLLALINDVLDITKIHSGMMKLFIEDDFDVAHELKEITATAEQLLAGKPVQLVTDIDSDFPPLRCDKRRIRQVLLNLVSNAVKFTEKGTITLSAKKRSDEVLFAVIDTGPGIPADQHDLIFEPFVQTETGIKHAGGTGLGMPISKQLILAHGGRLWIESTPGAGSAFYAAVPVQSDFALGEKDM
jgi:signal transduction histidine kinase